MQEVGKVEQEVGSILGTFAKIFEYSNVRIIRKKDFSNNRISNIFENQFFQIFDYRIIFENQVFRIFDFFE